MHVWDTTGIHHMTERRFANFGKARQASQQVCFYTNPNPEYGLRQNLKSGVLMLIYNFL